MRMQVPPTTVIKVGKFENVAVTRDSNNNTTVLVASSYSFTQPFSNKI
jgi:hypothetical protein